MLKYISFDFKKKNTKDKRTWSNFDYTLDKYMHHMDRSSQSHITIDYLNYFINLYVLVSFLFFVDNSILEEGI